MTFAVPDAMLRQIVPGCRVIVQLGARKYYTGIVDRLHGQRPPFDRIKPVGRIADAEPVATAEQLRLWHWLSEYYMCPLGMVLRAALPAGLKSDGFSEDETFGRGYMQPRQTVVSLHPDIRNEERLHVALDSLSRAKSQYKALLEYLEKTGNPDFGAPIEIPRKRLSAPTAILKALGRKRIYPDRRYRNPGIGRARRARQTARTFGSANGGLRADQNLFFGERGRPAARGNRQRQDRNLHPADGRSAGSRAQRAVHAARNRVDRTTDPAHGKLFRKSRHGLPFAAERQPPSRRLPRTAALRRRTDRDRRALVGTAAAAQPVAGNRRRGARHQLQATDSAPRYHGRDTAVVLASVCGAKVLLGSATPAPNRSTMR